MPGTVTITRDSRKVGKDKVRTVEVVTIDWVADSSAATIPNTSIDLGGYVFKAVTNPGATAPTDNYDIEIMDPEDSALDALAATLKDRDTANSEQVYPTVSGASIPIFLAGTYTLKISNNAVNSASGRIQLYLSDSL